MDTLITAGTYNLYSLPYWYFVEMNQWAARSITIEGRGFNIYFPYRTNPVNEPLIRPSNLVMMEGGACKIIADLPDVAWYADFTTDHKSWFAQVDMKWKRSFKPADTIRVDSEHGDFLNALLTRLLEITRVKSNQWWIGKAPFAPLFGGPVQGAFKDENIAPPPPGIFSPQFNDISFDEKIITRKMWDESLDNLEKGILAPIYKTSLLNSVYNLISEHFESCIFDLMQTLDTAFDINMNRLWMTLPNYSKIPYERAMLIKITGANGSDTNIPFLLDGPAKGLTNRSFREENLVDFERITLFWIKKRHMVAHGKPFEGKNDLFQDIVSVRECIRWIEEVTG